MRKTNKPYSIQELARLVSLYKKLGTLQAVANKLGMSRQAVQHHFKRVRRLGVKVPDIAHKSAHRLSLQEIKVAVAALRKSEGYSRSQAAKRIGCTYFNFLTRIRRAREQGITIPENTSYFWHKPDVASVIDVLKSHNGRRSEAARQLGVTPQEVNHTIRRARKLGITVPKSPHFVKNA